MSRLSAIFDSYADDSLPSLKGRKRTTLDKKCIELLVSLRYKKRADGGTRTHDLLLTMEVPPLGVLPANRNVVGAWHVVCGGLSPQ